jgi:hypothetical protein
MEKWLGWPYYEPHQFEEVISYLIVGSQKSSLVRHRNGDEQYQSRG